MELNYDLVRDILIEFAESNHAGGPTAKEIVQFAESNNISYDQLAFSLARMYEGGLVSEYPKKINNSYKIITPGNLTWQGNEYLNSIRNKNIWIETKNRIKKVGSKVTFETIISVASAIATHQLGLS